MKSILPFRITAALATCAFIMLAMLHGQIDNTTGVNALGMLFTFLVGVITHTEKPDPKDPPAS